MTARSGRARDLAAVDDADGDLLAARTVLEDELAVLGIDLHVVARVELAVQDLLAEAVLDLVLHRATQRPGAEGRVEPDLDELLLGRARQLDRHVAVEQALAEALDEQIDDLQQLLLVELREHDDVVDAVEELGLEVLLQLFLDLALHAVVRRRGVTLDLEADRAARDVPRAEVGGHDDDRVLEVDHATLTVGQATLFEDLQERVEDVGVRLLDLVEQHDARTACGAPSR